ncbi:MAG: hypothetical protein JST04_15950 [Bdellovibrionales bacterium]|nr:hypothetical protein [Bdellovibrionales bacterium]
MTKTITKRLKRNAEDASFLGVFFVGLILAAITANYYLNIEPHEERDARKQRIAVEVDRIDRLGHSDRAVAGEINSAK